MCKKGTQVNCLRIGGVNSASQSFSPIWKNGVTLDNSTYSIYNHMKVGCQILKKVEDLKINTFMIKLVYWNRESWTFGRSIDMEWPPNESPPNEFMVEDDAQRCLEKEGKDENDEKEKDVNRWGSHDLERLLCYLSFKSGIAAENIGTKKYSSYSVMNLSKIDDGPDSRITKISNYTKLIDGDRIVFYNTKTALKILTDGEKKLKNYQAPYVSTTASSSSSSSSSIGTGYKGYTYKKKTEKGVSIKTKKERNEAAKLKEEKEKQEKQEQKEEKKEESQYEEEEINPVDVD